MISFPLLYLSYGIFLAMRFGSRAEFINSVVNGLFLLIITIILIKMAQLKTGLDFIWFACFILYIFVLHHLVTYISAGDFASSTYTGKFHIQTELINLEPFTTIENTFRQTLPSMPTIVQIIGNALMLAPLSFFSALFQSGKTRQYRSFHCLFDFMRYRSGPTHSNNARDRIQRNDTSVWAFNRY